MSLLRKITRSNELKKQQEVKEMFKKKPQTVCPSCHLKSVFYTNKDGEVYCVRCDKKVAIKNHKKVVM